MKLNYKRTFFVGLAFMSICAFWQVYDNVIPLILKDTFHVRDSYIGIVMAMDNVLALFMLPLFGKLSDKTRTKIGRRMPYILGGHHSGASVPRHHARSTEAEQRPAVLHRPGAGAHCHGHLPQPRRGPDAGRHTQAPAQPGATPSST